MQGEKRMQMMLAIVLGIISLGLAYLFFIAVHG